jgi:hypothetical protein
MKLKFIADAYYNGVHVHKAGEVKEIDNSKGMAQRWLSRGIAVEADEVKEEIKEEVKEEIKEEVKEEIKEEVKEEAASAPRRKPTKNSKE